jgi:hypothetical protein
MMGPAPEQKGSSKTLGFVLIGIGGAGVVTGSIAGGMALSLKSALDKPDVCSPKSNCNPTAQSDIDKMKTAATISTVGFAVGGAAVVGGVIVLLTGKSSGEVRAGKLMPIVGPREVGVQGSF